MIRIAARTTNGRKLKMDTHVGSLTEAWEVLQNAGADDVVREAFSRV